MGFRSSKPPIPARRWGHVQDNFTPFHGESIRVEAKLFHELYIFFVAIPMIARQARFTFYAWVALFIDSLFPCTPCVIGTVAFNLMS